MLMVNCKFILLLRKSFIQILRTQNIYLKGRKKLGATVKLLIGIILQLSNLAKFLALQLYIGIKSN